MTKQTQEKLLRLINDTRYYQNPVPVFEYVDKLVARERIKIFKDLNYLGRKYHYGLTPKKRYNGLTAKEKATKDTGPWNSLDVL